jgi:hypothetical protein
MGNGIWEYNLGTGMLICLWPDHKHLHNFYKVNVGFLAFSFLTSFEL